MAAPVGLGVRVHVDRGEGRDVEPGGVGLGHGDALGLLRLELGELGRGDAVGLRDLGARVDSNASAITSALQPPSRKALRISVGCDHSESRSPPMPMAWPVTPADASEAR